MALLRATYRVRPATLTWLGAGSPSAAATKDGAAIDEPDSTAQSWKKVCIRSPRLVLKILTTSRSSGLSSCARSAAWKLPRSSWPSRASAWADWTRAELNASARQLRPLDDPHPGQCGDPRAVTLALGPEQDGHGLAVPGGQLLDDPAGERIFPADNELAAAGRDQGDGGHGVILNRPK